MRPFIFILLLMVLGASCRPKNNPQSPEANAARTETLQDSTLPDTLAEQPEESVPPAKFVFDREDLFKSANSDVVNALAVENYESARKKALHYLGKEDITPTQAAHLRYMHLYAIAGLVSEGNSSKAKLDQLCKDYQGQRLITQHLAITPAGGMPFNQIQVPLETEGEVHVSCANNLGINILLMLNLSLESPADFEAHLGKRAFLSGILTKGNSSPKTINSWIGELEMEQGTAHWWDVSLE